MAIIRGSRALGAFGERGGQIEIDDFPDAEVLESQLLKLSGHLDNTVLPMTAAKAIAKADMQNHFDKDMSPEGVPWTRLDPDYLEKKRKMKSLRTHAENILTLSTRLERAATSDAAWLIRGDTLFFSTAPLPFYWSFHQYGSGAENAGMAATHRYQYREGHLEREEGITEYAHSSLGIGRGSALPQRPFIGLSKQAIAQIAGVFDLWFDETVATSIHPRTGTVQERIGGRFGPKIFPSF